MKKDFRMKLEGHDLDLFQECLDYRLGVKALKKMENLKTTQKSEATNRSITASAPKSVTFSRNYTGRAHVAVSRVNRGPGQSMFDQLQFVGANLSPGSRVVRALAKMQRQSDLRRQYSRSRQARRQRCEKRHKLYRLYDRRAQEQCYKQGMVLEPQDSEHMLGDHCYATRHKYRPLPCSSTIVD